MLNVRPVEAAEKTPDIIQENELLYKTGNPHLRNMKVSKVTVDYTWLPNNRFSLSAFTGWSRDFNRIVPIFTPDANDRIMIRNLGNNGYYQNLYLGASFTAKLLRNSLVLRATPQMRFDKVSGIYADSNNYLSLSLNATYYIGKFYLSAYYSPAFRELVSQSMTATSVKRKSAYQLKLDGATEHGISRQQQSISSVVTGLRKHQGLQANGLTNILLNMAQEAISSSALRQAIHSGSAKKCVVATRCRQWAQEARQL